MEEEASKRDDFVIFIYQARKELQQAQGDARDGTKRTEQTEEISFRQARRMGYGGSLNEWRKVLGVKRIQSPVLNRVVQRRVIE